MLEELGVDKDANAHSPAVEVLNVSRALYVDWLRAISVYLVVLGHVVVAVVQNSRDVERLNAGSRRKINGSLRYFVQFMMPLFFYLSGRAVCFSRDSALVFIAKRAHRLLLPLVFGMILFVVPGQAMSHEWRACGTRDEHRFFHYYEAYFTKDMACNGVDWLWFLPVLFGIMVFNLPLVLWIRTRYDPTIGVDTRRNFKLIDVRHLGAQLALFVGLIIVMSVLFGGDGVVWVLTGLGGYTIIVFAFLFKHVLVRFLGPFGYHLLFLTPVITSCVWALVAIEIKFDLFLIPTICHHNMFFVGGVLAQMFRIEYATSKLLASSKRLLPVGLFVFLVTMGATAPTVADGVGYLWAWPLYPDDWASRLLFVIGGWTWIALLTRLGQAYYNETLSNFQYIYLSSSSFIVYTCHYFFILLVVYLITDRYELIWYWSVLIILVLSVPMMWIFFLLCLAIPPLGYVMGMPYRRRRSRGKKAQVNITSSDPAAGGTPATRPEASLAQGAAPTPA